jgi:DNA ligase D
VAASLAQLPCKGAVIDGEMVVQDPRGVTSINLLEQALSAGDGRSLTFFAFDLCHLDGFDLSAAPLRDRRQALEALLAPLIDDRSAVQFSDHVEGDGEALFAHASRMGLEGIVSKRADSPYVQSRSPNWVKVKRVDVASFVVIGFLTSGAQTASSLILAEEREGELVYAGRAGSGISEDRGRALYADLAPIEMGECVIQTPRTPGARWVEPRWTAEIGFRGRSTGGAPRAPVFMSLAPRRRVQPVKALKPRLIGDRDLAAVSLTNPERPIGAGGVTKLDIALYYARIGDWLLPELLRRPVTTIRCPTGDLRALFYQRHAFAGLPEGVATVELPDEEGRAAFITVTEPKGYLGLTQFGAIEFHLWGCHVDDPEHPDRLVIDLDPDEDLPWARVCDAAEALRERLETMGLSVFLRTTGGKGLHLVVALAPGLSWPLLKGFAEAFARAAAKDAPAMFTATSSKDRRKGRVYIDYLRNARGASAVASYSLRARPNFPVATPISWDELRKLPGGDAFTRLTVLKRVERLASDPWDGLGSSKAKITPKMRRDVGMKE